jgi:hypothetical protein
VDLSNSRDFKHVEHNFSMVGFLLNTELLNPAFQRLSRGNDDRDLLFFNPSEKLPFSGVNDRHTNEMARNELTFSRRKKLWGSQIRI